MSAAVHKQVYKNGRPVEIERKYLIYIPEISLLEGCEGYESSEIEQLYLQQGGRIRKRKFADGCKYYFTLKQEINGLSRYETEREISEEEYLRLRADILEGTRPICKTRHCFLYKGQLFELDVYEGAKQYATLEIELESEEQSVELPDFLDVAADVTGDKRFRNFALARIENDNFL